MNSYVDYFQLTDDLIIHIDSVLPGLNDPFLESRYTGFLSVSSITVLELAMKKIFIDFSTKKHKVLANFCNYHFERINGRISLKNIREDYIERFGIKYKNKFDITLNKLEEETLQNHGISIKSSYGNLLTWRHGFTHEGIIPPNASYREVKQGFSSGKKIMNCLASCMHR